MSASESMGIFVATRSNAYRAGSLTSVFPPFLFYLISC